MHEEVIPSSKKEKKTDYLRLMESTLKQLYFSELVLIKDNLPPLPLRHIAFGQCYIDCNL
jgi:hypothetical protein